MKKVKKLLAMTMASAMLATGLVGCASTPKIEVSDAIVATIDGIEVKESLYRTYLWSAQQYFEQISGPSIWDLDLEGVKTEEIAKDRALESAILSIATQKKAQEMGIELTKEEEKFAKDGAKNFAEINAEIMVNHKFGQKDVEELLLATALSTKLQTQLMENYIPPAEDVQKWVDENKKMFETVTAKHVLIKTVDDANQPLPEEELTKKKELAEKVLEKALAGEDMSELAHEYSEDEGSLPTDGEYTFGRGKMVPEFEQAAYDGKDGEVWPKLVKTMFGYHIIKTESHNPADEEELKALYIENEKMLFVNNEFTKMIESATVEKTDVFNQIAIYKPEPEQEVAPTEAGEEKNEGTTEDASKDAPANE